MFDSTHLMPPIQGAAPYIGLHRRSDVASNIARYRRDCRRAVAAVLVLVATEHLPESRTLYRRLHQAGALTPRPTAAPSPFRVPTHGRV